MKLIEEAENKEDRGYYEDDRQYNEKERLLFLKYDYNDCIGLISSDDEKFMNVYCKKYETVDENYDDDIDDDIDDDDIDDDIGDDDIGDDDIDENVVENDPNFKPASYLFNKPRPRSLLIYDD